MKIFKSLFVLFSFLMLSSCISSDSDNSCYEIAGTPTISVDGLTTTTVGVPIYLDITYSVINTCDTFYLYYEEISEGSKYVTVNVRYDGCDCWQNVTNRTRQYEFISDEVGFFSLRFKTTNTTYIEHIIEVTE